jgi:hypothetical protein
MAWSEPPGLKHVATAIISASERADHTSAAFQSCLAIVQPAGGHSLTAADFGFPITDLGVPTTAVHPAAQNALDVLPCT